jgi:hypothetical protein
MLPVTELYGQGHRADSCGTLDIFQHIHKVSPRVLSDVAMHMVSQEL